MALHAICTAQDICELNKTKEYTLTASFLLERVLTDTSLNGQASKVWQILFNKARFHPNLEVQIAYGYLAKLLGKSIRTIHRCVTTLIDNNYLEIKHNYSSDNGSQLPNTIRVRFPSDEILKAKQTKDRAKPTDTTIPQTDRTEGGSIPKVVTTKTDTAPSLLNSPKVATPVTLCDIQFIPSSTSTNASNIEPELEPKTQDKIVIGEGDKNVRQNNNKINNNKNINNNIPSLSIDKQQNNKPVVSSFKFIENNPKNVPTQNISSSELNKEIAELKTELESKQKILVKLKQLITKATEEEIKAYQNKIQLPYEKIQSNNRLRTDFDVYEIRLEYLQRNINEKEKSLKNQKVTEENPDYIAAKERPRPVSPFTFRRLNNSLEKLGYQGSSKIRLINEIIFEARFGSLINTNTTQTEMSIERSINIALKLVREGRWSTPAFLKY